MIPKLLGVLFCAALGSMIGLGAQAEPLATQGIGTSNCGLKLSRTYSFESLRLTNTAIWPGRRGGSALASFSPPGSFGIVTPVRCNA